MLSAGHTSDLHLFSDIPFTPSGPAASTGPGQAHCAGSTQARRERSPLCHRHSTAAPPRRPALNALSLPVQAVRLRPEHRPPGTRFHRQGLPSAHTCTRTHSGHHGPKPEPRPLGQHPRARIRTLGLRCVCVHTHSSLFPSKSKLARGPPASVFGGLSPALSPPVLPDPMLSPLPPGGPF